ncbi:MAG: 23S rRNA (uracil(1939)-C(5))-methyltransferase RlmD [Chromatiales bacterium]|jgi:23S rRNA (uracil1939-C5)-methyltransferase
MGKRKRRNRLPQEPVEVNIESLNHEGKGVTHIEGKTVFVSGALPGETVLCKYIKKQKRYDEAITLEVIKASEQRITPRCAQFGVCGGCAVQHLSSADQVAYKQQALLETLQRIGKVTPETVLPALLNDSPWGYRRKARLGVKYVQKKDKVLVGFRERGTSFITETDVCHVLHASVGENITALSELISQLSIRDRVPQIEVAIDDQQGILIFRILDELSETDKQHLLQFGEEHQLHIYVQSGGPETVTPLNGTQAELSYALPEYDIVNHFLPTDFTQVNTDINRKMVSLAMELMQPDANDKVLDLFCGLGNFTLPLAREVAQVNGVEGDTELVNRARQNAQANDIHNTDYFVTNLYEDFDNQPWMQQGYDKILLDPPRSGAFELVNRIDRFKAGRIVYVSCYPGTLARDLDVLVNQKGYRLEAVGVMDMFPHTAHIESIALLTKS